MLVLITIHLLSRSACATPINVAPRADEQNHPIFPQYRTQWGIFYNCLTTFVLCTWFAMHPNIPPHTDGFIKRFLRRLRLVVSHVMLPETIIIWATLQLWSAWNLAKMPEFKQRGWKLPHGFFVQMGGFVLHDADGKPLHVVWSRDVCDMLRSPLIESFRLTEKELEDRSKSDFLAKAVAVLTTSKFFLECIIRLAHRLPICELELVTFTYTIVNMYIYIVWWKKPQNVNCSFPVYEKRASKSGRRWRREFSPESKDEPEGGESRFLKYLGLFIAAPFHGTRAWAIDQDDKGIQAMAVPDLYYHGQKRTSSGKVLASTAIVGTIFGLCHVAAWNVSLGYHSQAEKIVWRVSCVALAAIPPILLTFVWIGTSLWRYTAPRALVWMSLSLCGPLSMLLYVAARGVLLLLPLTALRKRFPLEEMYISTYSVFNHTSSVGSTSAS